jgi:hypothetical protein
MFGIAVEFDIIENNPVRPRLHRPKYEPTASEINSKA